MNLRIFETADDLVVAAARTIEQRLRGVERAAIALSGGTNPRPLYELLAGASHRHLLEGKAITWVVVDERFVPQSDPQSNSAMIERTLFRGGLMEGHRFLRFRTEEGSPEDVAAQFAQEWRQYGLETLDIVILGCGEDGHTASLFPGTDVLDVEDRVAAAVFVPRLNQWRLTLTLPVIRAAKLRIVLAAGESKQDVIARARAGEDLPVVRATRGEGESWWMATRPQGAEQRNTNN